MPESRALSSAQLVRAALVVLVGFLASGVLGVVRQAVLAAQFGTTETLDAFLAAQRLPELIFVLVAGGALGSSFIPVYAQQRDGDDAQAWRLASSVMTLAAIAAALLGFVVIVLADPLVRYVLLPDTRFFVPAPAMLLRPADSIFAAYAQQTLTANMVRLMMVTPFIFSISGLLMGILQTHGLFLLPSLAISMNSIGIIFGALVLAPNLPAGADVAMVGGNNVYGLAYGAILSAVLHLVVQLPALPRIRARLRILPDYRVVGTLEVLRLMGPRVLGLGVVQLNFVVNIILTNRMIDGSLTALTVAFQLMFFALGIIAQSVGSAVFPTLSTLHAEGNYDGFKARLSQAMRSVLFLALPATVALILMSEPLISIFERGEWTAESTAATAWALRFYATGIAGFALLEVLSRAFYALADTWTPVLVGVGAILSNIVLSLLLVQVVGEPDDLARGPFGGLALANALTTLVEALVLWWLIRRRIGAQGSITGINDRYIIAGAWRAGVAAVVMGVVLWLLDQFLPYAGVVVAIIGAIVGGAVFFGTSIALGLPEARAIPMLVLRRFKR